MKSISYQIKYMKVLQVDDIRLALEKLPLVEKVDVAYSQDNETCMVVLKLDREVEESEENCSTFDTAVSEALASLGCEVQLPGVPVAEKYVSTPPPQKGKQIPLWGAVGSVVTAVVLAILITFGVTTLVYQKEASGIVKPGEGTQEVDHFAALDLIDNMFATMSPLETDKDALLEAVLKGYVSATGDRYAEYYNSQEYKDLVSGQKGEMYGIGVTVVNGHVIIDGVEYQAIVIANVYADSPAEENGVESGDYIVYVGLGEEKTLVQTIGYTEAMNRLKGEEGTMAEFVVYRATDDADDPYEIIEFSVERKKITTHSVTGMVCETDDKVGIVRVTTFDDTTAPQFKEEMTKLQNAGCEHFVIDMRGNGGGLLTSVEDMLTYFLQEGDVILTTKDKYDDVETMKVGSANADGKIQSGTGKLTTEDVGLYRDLSFVVLVNEYTASAAELFTANIRDYELGQIVGVTTYGKGSMQTTYSLAQYGYEGALKLTTRYYFPPSGEGYDGIGITPDVVVAMSEEVADQNINLLPHQEDNQLQAAIDLFYE